MTQVAYTILTQIFASVSHEFGTYLNCLVTLSQSGLLDQDIDQQIQLNYFKPLYANSLLLNLLLSNFRDYNQIILQQFMLQVDEFEIEEEINRIVELMQNTIEQRNIEVRITHQRVTEQQLCVFSDAARFRQVFYQIFSNAVRFTQNGFIQISIEPDIIKDGLIISIADTGIGMTEVEKENLNILLSLQKGVKVSTHSVGCGLGLMISNLIAARLIPNALPFDHISKQNGITFQTEVGKGSKFSFRIENKKVRIDASKQMRLAMLSMESYYEKRKSSVSPQIQQQSSLRGQYQKQKLDSKVNINSMIKESSNCNSSISEDTPPCKVPIILPQLNTKIIKYKLQYQCCSKVLIVDDEYFNIMSLQFLLKKFHTKIDHAFNGKEALDKVESKTVCPTCGNDGYVIYFLDINMPIMDGLETVVRLKEMMNSGLIDRGLCIANTGYVDLKTKLECYEKGMDFYISKPIDRAELHDFLKSKLNIV